MRVLVTGSDGFIGRHTVAALTARGDDVYGLDRKSGADLTSETGAEQLRVTLQAGIDYIVHLASTCSTPGSIRDPMGTYRDTVETAVTVMNAAVVYRVPVLMTSSVKARDGMTPYGAAKQMVETWTHELGSTYDLQTVINRPGTVYGPGQEGSDESGWIAWFLKAKAEDFPIVVNGPGTQRRDLLHVSDYVELLLRQLDDFGRYSRNKFWDVGGGKLNTVSVIEMAKHLGLAFEIGPGRYGDAPEYIGDNEVPFWTPRVYWKTSGMF